MMAHLALVLLLPLQGALDATTLPDGTPDAVLKKKQEEPAPKATKDDLLRRTFDWDVQFAPENDIYRTYLADPRQSKSGSKVQVPIRPKSEEASNIKIENVLGGHRPLVGWTDAAHPDVEMQLQVEAAVFSRFDIDEGWDMDAADYRFGFPFLYRTGDVILKVHPYHITSHMGDEYLSRVAGSDRKSYHLDELAIGVSFPAAASWRVYAEIGYGFYTGPETDAGRAQVGVEYIFEPISQRIAPFMAIDLQTRNEIDWNWNATAMIGLMMLPKAGNPGHGLRATLEYYRGSDSQTQFKEQREHFIAIGFAADF